MQAAPRADDGMETPISSTHNRGFATGAFAFVRSWWALLGASQPSSAQPLSASAAAAPLGDVASEPAASIDGAGAPTSDDAALHNAVSADFPHILVSLARASILSTLPVTAPTESFSAPRLVVNHRCTAVESDAGGAGALDTQPSGGWHDTCPLAAASWLADMSGVDLGKELAVIRRYLLRALPDLVSVDETAAAALVLDLLGAEQATEVIAALDKFPRLQVSLLEC